MKEVKFDTILIIKFRKCNRYGEQYIRGINMVELYSVKVPSTIDTEHLNLLMSYLSEGKRNRLCKFVNKQDIYRSLIGDLLIRNIIQKRYNLKNEDIQFTSNRFGKPLLLNVSDFYFNISHSGKWVVCAISNMQIGVDIEEVRSQSYLEIASQFFSNEEYKDIIFKKRSEQLNYFLDLWTLKESYVKFLGKGLIIPLNSFTVKKYAENNIQIYKQNRQIPYFFKQYKIDNLYKFSICANQGNLPKKVFLIDFPTLCNELSNR
jgi:4'-phosphopantetheinyl transferase